MIVTNTPLVDWLTVTTWDQSEAKEMRDYADMERAARGGVSRPDARVMQYDGTQVFTQEGTLFVGAAEQRGVPHYIFSASGYAADGAWSRLYHRMRTGEATWNVTRIDLQVTIGAPADWSQWHYFNRLKRAGRVVSSYVESRAKGYAGTLATVYAGARTSDRLIRVYEKLGLGDDLFLRFEIEFKGERARKVARLLCALDAWRIGDIIKGELERVGDKQLLAIFLDALDGFSAAPVRVQRGEPKAEKFLLRTCLPALERYLNEHGATSDVAYAYIDLITRYLGRDLE